MDTIAAIFGSQKMNLALEVRIGSASSAGPTLSSPKRLQIHELIKGIAQGLSTKVAPRRHAVSVHP